MIFSSNFFPCVDYFRHLVNEEVVKINVGEQYQKQSYRTRAYILGPHKIETISVPVKKYRNHELIKNIEVDYSENWNLKGWKTIETCYRNSPYFEYLADYIRPIFDRKYDKLVELNQQTLTVCLKILGIKKTICLDEFSYYDYNSEFIYFNAKNRLENQDSMPFKPYSQVFGKEFEANLSILDVLFTNGRLGQHILK